MPRLPWKAPLAHALHFLWPVVGWKLPTSHGSHRSMLRCAL